MTKKIILIIGLLITLLIIALFVLHSYYYGEYRDCVETKSRIYSNRELFRGYIQVGFKENVSREEAERVIKSYGFSVIPRGEVIENISWGKHKTLRVKTPYFRELYSLCVFENDSRVKIAEADFKLYLT